MIFMGFTYFFVDFFWKIDKFIKCDCNTNHFFICHHVFKLVSMLIFWRKHHLHSKTFIFAEFNQRSIFVRLFRACFKWGITFLSIFNNFLKTHQTLSWINDQNLVSEFDFLPVTVSFKWDVFVKVDFVKSIRWNIEKSTEIVFQYFMLFY